MGFSVVLVNKRGFRKCFSDGDTRNSGTILWNWRKFTVRRKANIKWIRYTAGDYSIAVGENILIDASAALSIAGQDHQLDCFNCIGNGITATGTENIAAGASHNVTGNNSGIYSSILLAALVE